MMVTHIPAAPVHAQPVVVAGHTGPTGPAGGAAAAVMVQASTLEARIAELEARIAALENERRKP